MCQSSSHQWLCNISSIVCSRSIHFSWIFSWECTTSMRTPSSICINNDFSSSESSISSRPSNIKLTRWINNDVSVFEEILWDDFLDDLGMECFFNLLVTYIRVVLCWYQDIIHSVGDKFTILSLWVLNNNLWFTVWSKPWNGSILPCNSHLMANCLC